MKSLNWIYVEDAIVCTYKDSYWFYIHHLGMSLGITDCRGYFNKIWKLIYFLPVTSELTAQPLVNASNETDYSKLPEDPKLLKSAGDRAESVGDE